MNEKRRELFNLTLCNDAPPWNTIIRVDANDTDSEDENGSR